MDPDSRWILKEMVNQTTERRLLFADSGGWQTQNRAQWQRVQALLLRHADGSAVLESIRSLDEAQQRFVVHWIDVVARSDSELARVFASRAARALTLMDSIGVEHWLIQAMDAYDKRGLGRGVAVLEELDSFAADYAERHRQVRLDQQLAVLQPIVIGLGGRSLTVTTDESASNGAYTDSESIFLPATQRHFTDQALNRQLLLAQAVFLWAQNYYGTWQQSPLEQLAVLPRPQESQAIYAMLERFRVEARLARDLPGLHRYLQELQQQGGETPLSPAWQQARARLDRDDALADDSIALVETLRGEALPEAAPYQGTIHPERVRQVLEKRLVRERQQLQKSLSELEQTVLGRPQGQPQADDKKNNPGQAPGDRFSVSETPARAEAGRQQPQLEYRGRKVGTPAQVQGLLTSIQQDLGEVPEDYLAGGGNDTPYDADAEEARDREYTSGEPLHYAEGALSYPEWDYNRQRYRQDYCILREQPLKPGDPAFIHETLQKYRGPLKSIRRSFEAVLGEDRLLRRQPDGDDIDIDALIEAQADRVRGEEMDDRVYSRHRRVDRDIAVMLMVDMSGSTRGWVNDAERESLVLLCEALETLGDRYAIYGFSGRTHTRCAIYPIKRFDENYSQTVRERISGIKPQTYTRMGVAIRHLGGLLGQVPARTKLLVTLSDGKPEDYGSYRGRYGIEDTRRALIEARRSGIHAFCITIDQAGGDYLPHMYGPANYAVIDQVSQLPLKVADIYRRLTT
ncbi:nitric oxide reductase NorD protein [Methylohalomonas lacus]|uniref:Nitric oxide reductase NorD protein n=1 Tax=Methylohalomonas lacus TaxID=398773 RepID=A0AAE3L505_9GAMM|nr:hypothetical protein [Methylohalomonas lacus]MCS3902472.1 nitric oxide reductase NorD protein [Methylohalomonas lacus]